jgi:hypothetical protein
MQHEFEGKPQGQTIGIRPRMFDQNIRGQTTIVFAARA